MPTTFHLIESSPTLTHVAVVGALDLAGTREIELKLTATTAGRHKPVIIDLSQVSFLSSAGLGLLIQIARSLRADKHSVVALAPNETSKRVIQISKLDFILRIAGTLEEALELAKLPASSVAR